ncbi:hypothetical protein ABZY09_27870 [Streptomyces sp. NPDC002928]|uniref:hypothetical protein n=1 Tax=Streptomyces sp. NPDC002928 TaxID=3154440 RepID=UPI0033A79E44
MILVWRLPLNVSHFTPEDLSVGARHDYQLTPREEVVLRLNHRQMGVGGDNCARWPTSQCRPRRLPLAEPAAVRDQFHRGYVTTRAYPAGLASV